MASIARIIFDCDSDATFIWKEMREMPPSASACRKTLSVTSSRADQQRAVRAALCVETGARHRRYPQQSRTPALVTGHVLVTFIEAFSTAAICPASGTFTKTRDHRRGSNLDRN
jgi:hypothetical protein